MSTPHPAFQLPLGVTFHGYHDSDEHYGETILDLVQARIDFDPNDMQVGAVFSVCASWVQDQEWRVARRAPLEVERISPPIDTPQSDTQAVRDLLAERKRQVEVALWTHEHDDAHPSGEIAAFAAVYAMPPAARDWPASETGYGDTLGAALCPVGWHPKFGNRRRELVKAGALILAEIERMDRAAAPTAQEGGAV